MNPWISFDDDKSEEANINKNKYHCNRCVDLIYFEQDPENNG